MDATEYEMLRRMTAVAGGMDARMMGGVDFRVLEGDRIKLALRDTRAGATVTRTVPLAGYTEQCATLVAGMLSEARKEARGTRSRIAAERRRTSLIALTGPRDEPGPIHDVNRGRADGTDRIFRCSRAWMVWGQNTREGIVWQLSGGRRLLLSGPGSEDWDVDTRRASKRGR